MAEPAELLSRLPGLGDAKLGESLGRGPVSDSWRVAADDRSLVLRLDRPLARKLGLDRTSERTAQALAAAHGLAPAIRIADPEAGVLVTDYLDPHDGPWGWEAHGRLLARVHALDVPGLPRFDLPAIAARYARLDGSATARALQTAVTDRARALYADTAWTLCHHDPHGENQVGGRFIDWEYAALGDPLFDLAALVRHERLAEADQEALFRGWGRVPDAGRFHAFLSLYDDLAALWSLAVEAGSA